MNTLSIFLYLADVIQNLQGVFGVMSFLLLVITMGLVLLKLLEGWATLKWAVLAITMSGFFSIAGALIPTKQTMYLIASSQLGEQVIKTPEAQELFTKLKARIMEELDGEAVPQ